MTRGILFDAADIFYARREHPDRYVLRLLQEHGYPVELPAQDVAFLKSLQNEASVGRVGHEDYWHACLQKHGVMDPAQQAAFMPRILECANQVYALPGAAETVAALKRRGFILGVVTDTMYPLEWKMNWLAQAGVAEFIDVVACSTVLGVRKPDPAIYLDALHKAQLTVAESAFVGHDAGELAGARRVGLTTIAVWYDPSAQADYYAQSLVEILALPLLQQAG